MGVKETSLPVRACVTKDEKNNSVWSGVPLGEGDLRVDGYFALAALDGHHAVPEVASFAVHLDALLQELLLWDRDGGKVEDVYPFYQ